MRWEKKAERELTHKLRKLFKIIFERTISKLQEMKSVPSSDILRKPLLFEIESLREEFKEIISESVIESVNVGRERVLLFADSLAVETEMHFENLIMKQAIVEIPLLEYSKQFEKLIRDSVFIASDATMDRIVGDITENLADSYVQGLGIGEASNRLKKVFDFIEDYRLERIARTEIQSYQNLGSHHTCIDLGVQYEQWWTARDERVRSSHAHLHGQIVRTGDRFSNGLMYPGDRSGPIEEWINCFTGDTLISATEVKRVYRRFYEGEIITIKTALGNKLTGTPNHPILTSKGWIALGEINKGDNVISTTDNFKISLRNPDNNYIKTSFEKIYILSSKLNPVERIGLKNMDFHTDGRGSKEVNVITTDSILGNDFNISFSKFFKQFLFPISNILLGGLSCNGSFDFFSKRNYAASNGLMGFLGKPFAFGFGSIGHSNIHSLRPISSRNIRFNKMASNYIPGNFELGSKRFDRYSTLVKLSNFIRRQIDSKKIRVNRNVVIGKPFSDNFISNTINLSNGLNRIIIPIKMDNVIDVSRSKFNGHVYNLQSKDEYYISNNIITHNCRCRLVPFLMPFGYTAPLGRSYFYEGDLISEVEEPEISDFDKAAERIENKIKKRKTEKAFILDEEGNVIYEKSGDRNRVQFNLKECEYFRGNIFIHNHPGASPFSGDDINIMIRYKIKEMRAIGVDYEGNTHKYIMKLRTPGVYPTGEKIRKDYKVVFKGRYSHYEKMYLNGEIEWPEAVVKLGNELWTEIIKKNKELIYISEII